MQVVKKILVYCMTFSILNLGTPIVVQAHMIGTLDAIEATRNSHDLAIINAALARTEVQQQLSAMGIRTADVQARVAAMTDSEVNLLAGKISAAPAGGDFFAVVGIVFIVLLILELVGVIDIFKKFP